MGEKRHIDFEAVKFDKKVLVGRGNVGAGGSVSLMNWTEKGEGSFSAVQVGAGGRVGSDGVGVGVQARLCRIEAETNHFKLGSGFSLDTGFKATRNGVRAEYLGFGFGVNQNGISGKIPCFDLTFKF